MHLCGFSDCAFSSHKAWPHEVQDVCLSLSNFRLCIIYMYTKICRVVKTSFMALLLLRKSDMNCFLFYRVRPIIFLLFENTSEANILNKIKCILYRSATMS